MCQLFQACRLCFNMIGIGCSAIRLIGRPARTASMRHRSINRNSAVASGSSFFNGWRSTPGTTPLTSQLVLLISTTTTKVEIGSNAARLRLRSLTCGTGQPPSVRMDDEGATTSAAPPHSFSHLGCVTAKRFSLRLAVCAPAPVTHLPGSASGACFAGSHSPWPLPFAPPAPRRSRPLCSSASQLLWQSLTSRDRASSATAPRLPDADRRQLPNGRSRDLPVPAQGASAHARFFDHAGSFGPCDGASETCCLPHSKRRRHPEIGFRGSMAGLCPPLPTLRRRPRGRQRTARGRCRSLLLHRSGLAPPTPCRSPGALRVLHAQPRSPISTSHWRMTGDASDAKERKALWADVQMPENLRFRILRRVRTAEAWTEACKRIWNDIPAPLASRHEAA